MLLLYPVPVPSLSLCNFVNICVNSSIPVTRAHRDSWRHCRSSSETRCGYQSVVVTGNCFWLFLTVFDCFYLCFWLTAAIIDWSVSPVWLDKRFSITSTLPCIFQWILASFFLTLKWDAGTHLLFGRGQCRRRGFQELLCISMQHTPIIRDLGINPEKMPTFSVWAYGLF